MGPARALAEGSRSLGERESRDPISNLTAHASDGDQRLLEGAGRNLARIIRGRVPREFRILHAPVGTVLVIAGPALGKEVEPALENVAEHGLLAAAEDLSVIA